MNIIDLPEINTRIKQIIDLYSSGNIADFARSLPGISQQRLDRLFKLDKRNGKYPTVHQEITQAILDKYPINSDWLLTGSGEMLKTTKAEEAVFINNPNFKFIPLVSQYAQAGYLCGFADVGYMESLPTIPTIVDHEIKGNYMAFEVRGDSMDNGTKESLEEGEILICREVTKDLWQYKLHLHKWNFVIVHQTEGIVVKRITEHNVEKGLITIHSLNPFYPDRVLELKDISQIFNVVQIHRKGNL